MTNHFKSDPLEVLKAAKTILLVDWPNPGVPRALLKAGFKVYSYSPDEYTAARLGGDDDVLFDPLVERLGQVDIVNVYRPEEELYDIIMHHVLPLKAKVLWLHPPITSPRTREFAIKHGIIFIEGADISEIAAKI